ncbi:MAG: arsenate reductase (glutaredoxin) [Flavobacteriaceae bacterium]
MIEIYHNPRCRKSREGLAILENSGKEFKVVHYLTKVPSKKTLSLILEKLGMRADQLIRKNEAIWKEEYKGKDLSEDELIDAMVKNPKLIERPIVVEGEKAVLGRPPEQIESFISR